jgi:CHAT domain-containing protein
MEHFYQRLAAGRHRDQALREASLAMLADAGHSAPYQWAAFNLMGRVE